MRAPRRAAPGSGARLVPNAGVASFVPVADEDEASFDRTFGVNVDGVHAGTRAALPHLADGRWVNVIQPGPIDTDLNPADGPLAGQMLPLIPLGRYGHPDEVANVAAFLAGDQASFITGAAIDGGDGTGL